MVGQWHTTQIETNSKHRNKLIIIPSAIIAIVYTYTHVNISSDIIITLST